MSLYLKSPIAERDLDDIWWFIALDNPDAADTLIRRVEAQCGLLANNPAIGRLRPNIGENLRSFPVGSYVLIYRQTDAGITLLRVLHGSRDLPGLLGGSR